MSRIFKSIYLKPPKPEEVASRRYTVIDTWHMYQGRMGLAQCSIEFYNGDFFVVYNHISGDPFTHWRWAEEPDWETLERYGYQRN